MPDNGAQMYTFQLDSEAAEKVNDGHYKVTLTPSLELPLLAQPQAMVRSVVFSNSFANVQSTLYRGYHKFTNAFAQFCRHALWVFCIKHKILCAL